MRDITAGERRYAIVVGSAGDVETAARETVAAKGRCHPIADWLTGNRAVNLAAANERLSPHRDRARRPRRASSSS